MVEWSSRFECRQTLETFKTEHILNETEHKIKIINIFKHQYFRLHETIRTQCHQRRKDKLSDSQLFFRCSPFFKCYFKRSCHERKKNCKFSDKIISWSNRRIILIRYRFYLNWVASSTMFWVGRSSSLRLRDVVRHLPIKFSFQSRYNYTEYFLMMSSLCTALTYTRISWIYEFSLKFVYTARWNLVCVITY